MTEETSGGGKKVVAYVDVGFRENKKHTVLLRHDGVEEIKKVESLLDLLDQSVQTVFIDALIFRVIPEVKTLVENNIKVFYLRDLRLLRTMRDKNGMKKSDENDAKILSIIQPEKFRECSLDYLRLRELLMKYHWLRRRIQKIQQWNEVTINSSKEYIRECRVEMERIEDQVHEMATKTLPLYKDVIGFIGVDKSIDVAELLTIVDFNRGFRKLRRYTGHFSIPKKTRTGKVYITKPKKYSHRARICLERIANHIMVVEMVHRKDGQHVDGRLWCEVAREWRNKKKASLKIQTMLLKFIRGLARAQTQATGRA